jgi:hypothetical protein
VAKGDCISSIAFDFGFDPLTVWNHPSNAALKKKRSDPNVLMEGDLVSIPAKQVKKVAAAVDLNHTYVRKGVPEQLRIRLLNIDGTPRAGLKYTLEIDGALTRGQTDSRGVAQCSISPGAMNGTLTVGNEVYELSLGALMPVSEPGGVNARLIQLGFLNSEDADLQTAQWDAIVRFQQAQLLKVTGVADQETLAALIAAFRS